MPSISEGLGDLNEILDRGFQACFEICEELPNVFGKHAKGLYEIETEAVETLLKGVLNRLYDRMAWTLYAVLCRMEAIRQGPEKINFYFWPGYFSLLLKRRIYFTADVSPIEGENRFRDVGIGFCGSHRNGVIDTETVERYQDCSQARWYHYAWKLREPSHPAPGSVYRWFREQRPKVSEGKHDLIGALTVATDGTRVPTEDLNDYDAADNPQRFQFVLLDKAEKDPAVWAQKVADKMNSALSRYVEAPKISFPDTPSSSKIRRPQAECDVRLLELGLWMHSVFCDHLPENLKEMTTKVREAGYSEVARQLENAKKDRVAAKDEKSEKQRLTFADWSTISLHPMLSPPMLSRSNYERSFGDHSIERETIGSAVFLSSAILGKEFLGLVRYWVRTVYGMIRNSESLVLSHNEMLQTSRRFAMIAGPWFAHEINAILGKNTSLKAQLANCSDEAVSLRRLVINTAESVSLLAYIATSAVLDSNPKQQKPVQARFSEPLCVLNRSGVLRERLFAAARMVYHDAHHHRAKSGGNGTIPVLEGYDPAAPQDITGVCFLLVNELVTNHVRHSRDKSPAEFDIRVGNGKVEIKLAAHGEKLPGSKTLGYLNQMLAAFGMGEVSTERISESSRKFETRITVQFEN